MSKRGSYRQGHYLALLYSLETHYGLEALQRGPTPSRWQPLPRNRVDQFFRLITGSLEAVGVDPPQKYQDLLRVLEGENLPRVAQVLRFVTARKVEQLASRRGTRLNLASVSLSRLMARLQGPTGTTELHPQARKLARVLVTHLDTAWCDNARRAARQEGENWPQVSVILGSLPPGFSAVRRQVTRGLARSGRELPSELSVAQFYALATGSFPRPKETWREASGGLESLSDQDVYLLKSLSRQQREQLSGLSREAFLLLLSLRSIRQATGAWRDLVEKIYRREGDVQSLLARWKRSHNLDIRQLTDVQHLLEPRAWRQAKAFDEELVRLVDKGELNLALFFKLQTWTRAAWEQLQAFSDDDWLWSLSYLEEKRTAARFAQMRTPARLDLRTLFPATIAWLDTLVESNLESVLLRDLEPVSGYAEAYAGTVKERLFGGC